MRNLLLAFIIILNAIPSYSADLPQGLLPAAQALERSAAQSLGVAHQLFENATDTHAAWVLMRDVATVRSQSVTLVACLNPQTPHVDVARKLVKSMTDLSVRIEKLLGDPELGPEDQVLALLAQWTKTKTELVKVSALMPAPSM